MTRKDTYYKHDYTTAQLRCGTVTLTERTSLFLCSLSQRVKEEAINISKKDNS